MRRAESSPDHDLKVTLRASGTVPLANAAQRPARRGSFDLSEGEPQEPGLLMTSMIDVIFILLAFFVCVSEIKKGTLNVDVPEVADAQSQAEAGPVDPVIVEITSKGDVFVAGEAAEGDALEALLRREAEQRGVPVAEIPVELSIDKRANAGTVMRAMGRATKVGFQKLQFPVESGGN